ncbi:hypothetical protein H5410_006542 [Solanum commersonii]|uniref:Uncharacterized protein n=1 Tax=Solanum commersonii TaxID=4109 RepID=A0A9J6AAI6_SOLCO|nr:hypothetical protein H5410_006542 [Solanum commersonii]
MNKPVFFASKQKPQIGHNQAAGSSQGGQRINMLYIGRLMPKIHALNNLRMKFQQLSSRKRNERLIFYTNSTTNNEPF